MRPAFAPVGLCSAILLACLFAAIAGAGVRVDSNPTRRHADTMDELVVVLDEWLDHASPWPQRPPPEIRFISPQDAVTLAGLPGRGHGATQGLYDAASETIYLVQPWNRRDAYNVSVLLHELIHHRQAAVHWACPGAQELPAYRLQEEWLAERGLQVDANWIAVVLNANCRPRDFHPD